MFNNKYKLCIKFPTDTEYVEYDASLSDFKLTEKMHSNLQSCDNYLKVSIIHNISLENKLRGLDDNSAKAYITCNDERFFTGYIRRGFTFQNTTRVQNTSIELVSPSFMLKVNIPQAMRYTNIYICKKTDTDNSLLHKLFTAAGFSAEDLINVPDILVQLPYFSIDADSTTYHDVINNLLYEYGYILDFDKNGLVKTYELTPSDITTTQAFTTGVNGNIRDALKQTVQRESYQKFSLTWNSIKTVEDAVVFSDTSNATSTDSCIIDVAPLTYYGESEADSQGLYLTYGMDGAELLYAQDCSLNLVKDEDLRLDEFTDYGVQGFLKLYNTNTTYDKTIRKLEVTGNAIVKDATNVTKVNNSSGTFSNLFEYTSQYIFDKTNADKLVNALANYYKYADYTYTLISYDDFDIGSIVTINDPETGILTCRVISKETEGKTGKHTYQIEGVGEYSPATGITTESKKDTSASVSNTTLINKVYAQLQEEVSDLVVSQKIILYKRSATTLSSTRITSDSEYNFSTGNLTWEDAEGINGWSPDYPTGNEPVYITVATVTGAGTETIEASSWSTPVVYVKNGENGVNNAEIYYVLPSVNLVKKYKNGTLSNDSVIFTFYKSVINSRTEIELYYVIEGCDSNNLWNIIQTGSSSSVEIDVADYVELKCSVYNSESDTSIPLDAENVLILAEGTDAIICDLSNENVQIPCTYDGTAQSLNHTNTILYVLSGSAQFNFGDANKRGEYAVTVELVGCTVDTEARSGIGLAGIFVDEEGNQYIDADGNPYFSDAYVELPNISTITADIAYRKIRVEGTAWNGETFTFDVTQTFTKVYYGKNGTDTYIKAIEYAISDSVDEVPTTWYADYPTEISEGKFLWIRKTWTDGNTEWTDYSFSKMGSDGNNGWSNASIILYRRGSSSPSMPTGTYTYKFSNPTESYWSDGSSQGWTYSKPGLVYDKLPLWEIHATASSLTDTDTILPSEWSNPVETQVDGYSVEEVDHLLQETVDSLVPTFECDYNAAIFRTDEDSIVVNPQRVVLTFNCKQQDNDIEFNFSSVSIPDAFSYEIKGNKVYITAKASTTISEGVFMFTLKVPVSSEVLKYTDGSGMYKDENGNDYQFFVFTGDEFQKTFAITYSVVKGGKYYEGISSINNIPTDALDGDYFTWTSSSIVSSTKSRTGSFIPGVVYYWDGEKWAKDVKMKHLAAALSDVLGTSKADIAKNNSKVWQYLDHLTANTIFVDQLTANEAFVDKLTANEAFITNLQSDFASISALNAGTIEIGGYTKTSDFNSLKSVAITSNNETMLYYLTSGNAPSSPVAKITSTSTSVDTWTTNIPVYPTDTTGKGINATKYKLYTCIQQANTADGIVTYSWTEPKIDLALDKLYSQTFGKTIIKNGYIDTDYIKAGAIDADCIDTESLSAKVANFGYLKTNELKTDIAEIEDLYVSGQLKSTQGIISLNQINIYAGGLSSLYEQLINKIYTYDQLYMCSGQIACKTDGHTEVFYISGIKKEKGREDLSDIISFSALVPFNDEYIAGFVQILLSEYEEGEFREWVMWCDAGELRYNEGSIFYLNLVF